jgi:hypothetical protein
MSLLHTATALAAGLCVACATPAEGPEPAEVADTSTTPLPACAETGTLFAVTLAGDREDLKTDSELRVSLGFQAFQFAQVGLRSPLALLEPTRLTVYVDVPGKLTYSVAHPRVHTSATSAAWETSPELVFFNDAPMADLLGQAASLTMRASTGTCLLSATADVVLVDGGFADENAPIWGDGTP